ITTPSTEGLEPLTTTTTTLAPTTTTTTTTTLPPTTTTTTTTLPPTTTTTTTTIPPNPKIFMALTPPDEGGTYTNDSTPLNRGNILELVWSTDSADTQKYNGATEGVPLYSNTTLRFNWVVTGTSTAYFIITDVTGLTGIVSGTTGSSMTYDLNLNAGDNRGYVHFSCENSGATLSEFNVIIENVPDPIQELGLISESSDVKYVLKQDMPLIGPTTYGYLNITSNNIKMVHGVS
ncbi:unnamed protein product, partial [marine sediment metagenome]